MDGITTNGTPAGARVACNDELGAVYLLKEGTEAENVPLIIRPDDYAPAGSASGSGSIIDPGNEKYWELLTTKTNVVIIEQEIVAPSNTGLAQNGNFKWIIEGVNLVLYRRVSGAWKKVQSFTRS